MASSSTSSSASTFPGSSRSPSLLLFFWLSSSCSSTARSIFLLILSSSSSTLLLPSVSSRILSHRPLLHSSVCGLPSPYPSSLALFLLQPSQPSVYPYFSNMGPVILILRHPFSCFMSCTSVGSSKFGGSKLILMGITIPGLLGSGLCGVPFILLILSPSHLSSGPCLLTEYARTTPSSVPMMTSLLARLLPSQMPSSHSLSNLSDCCFPSLAFLYHTFSPNITILSRHGLPFLLSYGVFPSLPTRYLEHTIAAQRTSHVVITSPGSIVIPAFSST